MGPDELLPEQTSDDRDFDAADAADFDGRDSASHDEWLRDQVPPHHGE